MRNWLLAIAPYGFIAIAEERAGFCLGPLWKGATVVSVVAAAIAQRYSSLGLVQWDAWMPKSLQGRTTMGAHHSVVVDGSLATGTIWHC